MKTKTLVSLVPINRDWGCPAFYHSWILPWNETGYDAVDDVFGDCAVSREEECIHCRFGSWSHLCHDNNISRRTNSKYHRQIGNSLSVLSFIHQS